MSAAPLNHAGACKERGSRFEVRSTHGGLAGWQHYRRTESRRIQGARVAAVVRRHERTLLRVALQASLCHDDALDAYQRALEIFMRRVDTVDPATEVAWLKVVIRHEAMAIRRARTEAVADEDLDLDSLIPVAERSVEEQIASSERVRRSAEALRALKPDEAKALMMKAHGLSYEEIGERNGWTYTKTNRAITEGRRRFMAVFEGIESGEECERFAPIVEALALGSATAAQLLSIRPHLRHCMACRAAVRDLHLSRLHRALFFPGLLLASTPSVEDRLRELADHAPASPTIDEHLRTLIQHTSPFDPTTLPAPDPAVPSLPLPTDGVLQMPVGRLGCAQARHLVVLPPRRRVRRRDRHPDRGNGRRRPPGDRRRGPRALLEQRRRRDGLRRLRRRVRPARTAPPGGAGSTRSRARLHPRGDASRPPSRPVLARATVTPTPTVTLRSPTTGARRRRRPSPRTRRRAPSRRVTSRRRSRPHQLHQRVRSRSVPKHPRPGPHPRHRRPPVARSSAHDTHQEHPMKVLRRLALIIILVLLAGAGATPALAGEYPVYACEPAHGNVNGSWIGATGGGGTIVEQNCPTARGPDPWQQGLVARHIPGANAPQGAFATVDLHGPAGRRPVADDLQPPLLRRGQLRCRPDERRGNVAALLESALLRNVPPIAVHAGSRRHAVRLAARRLRQGPMPRDHREL